MRTYSEKQLKKLFQDKKLLIVSYEAGSGNILSSLIKRLGPKNLSFVLSGPACVVFQKKLGNLENLPLSKDLMKKNDIVITGTSLVPEFERKAISMAKEAHKHCISIMDNWVNYRERFIPVAERNLQRDLEDYLPDEIWISDNYASEIALKMGFPEEKLACIKNFYLLEKLENARKLKVSNHSARSILYISEPVYDDVDLLYGDGNAWGYNEYTLVADLLESLLVLTDHFEKVIFRLHPNEKSKKYKKLFANYKGKLKIEVTSFRKTTVEEDCSRAKYVVGTQSMALVVALMFGKKVFSCLPKTTKRSCSLPHKKIIRINSVKDILNFIDDDVTSTCSRR